MLPSSHQVPIELLQASSQETLLAAAFSEFISASAKLELSYRDLQAEVAELSLALSERSQELHESLSENRSMGLTLQRIVEAMPCGVLVIAHGGAVRLANPEAARLLALSAAQMPTLSSIEAETGLNLQCFTVGEESPEHEQELSFESSAGRHWIAVRHVQLSSEKSASAHGQAAEAVLTLQDISARKRLERERESARDAVALAQVSALLAHEIRNPLASLELFAGLIADSPERRDEWISHLRAGIRSLSGTVNNVLALHGGAAPAMERLDLLTEAKLAVDFLQPLAQQANVALLFAMDEFAIDGEPQLRANKSAFHQLLLNLCSNALRHTSPGGTVTIRCGPRPAQRGTLIAVTDTGCGIPKEHLPKLFEGGFSGSGTTPGLGLAVCERLMRQHGGAIHVASRVGHGSTFTLEFQPS